LFLFLRCTRLFLMSPAVLWEGSLSAKLSSLETCPFEIQWLVSFAMAWEVNSVKELGWPFAAQSYQSNRSSPPGRSKSTNIASVTVMTYLYFLFNFNFRWRFFVRNQGLTLTGFRFSASGDSEEYLSPGM
jgi:hypothetical protein